MQKAIIKRIEELENMLESKELIFKIEDKDGKWRKVTFHELMAMQEKPHYSDDGKIWYTGFPRFRVCGGNNSSQITELLNKIDADSRNDAKRGIQ